MGQREGKVGQKLPFLHTKECRERIMKLKEEDGYTAVQIATIIGKEHDVVITPNSIQLEIKKIINKEANINIRNKEVTDRAHDKIDIITEQLNRINEKAWEIINNMDTSKADTARTALAALQTILKQLEFSTKKLESLTKPEKVEISNLEFSVLLNKYIDKLVANGYIKRIKKRKALDIDENKEIPLKIEIKESVSNV